MKLADQPAEIQSTFAFWQVFRALGFESDDLWVGMFRDRLIVQVEQNGKGYPIAMGTTTMPQEEFEALWLAWAESLPTQPEADLKANYEKWVTEERWEQMIMSLIAAGVEIPAHKRKRMN